MKIILPAKTKKEGKIMKMKMRNIMLIGGTVLGLILLAYPTLSGNAQKMQRANKMQQENSPLAVIQANGLTKSFYDNLQQGERKKGNKWTLTEAYYSPKSELTGGANMSSIHLNNAKDEILIDISERDNNLKSVFGAISQGRMEKCERKFLRRRWTKSFWK